MSEKTVEPPKIIRREIPMTSQKWLKISGRCTPCSNTPIISHHIMLLTSPIIYLYSHDSFPRYVSIVSPMFFWFHIPRIPVRDSTWRYPHSWVFFDIGLLPQDPYLHGGFIALKNPPYFAWLSLVSFSIVDLRCFMVKTPKPPSLLKGPGRSFVATRLGKWW